MKMVLLYIQGMHPGIHNTYYMDMRFFTAFNIKNFNTYESQSDSFADVYRQSSVEK